MIKKIMSFVFAVAIIFTLPTTVYASPLKNTDKHLTVEEFAEQYDVTEDEVIHLEENLTRAKESLKDSNMEIGEEKVIPISENLVLRLQTEFAPNARKTIHERTITATMSLENVLGMTVIELRSIGVFRTDGSTSTPVDAYGSYDSWTWNITNTSSSLGSPAYNARVRNTFSGELNIGIDDLHLTIQSFNNTCTIYCNAVGTASASWK